MGKFGACVLWVAVFGAYPLTVSAQVQLIPPENRTTGIRIGDDLAFDPGTKKPQRSYNLNDEPKGASASTMGDHAHHQDWVAENLAVLNDDDTVNDAATRMTNTEMETGFTNENAHQVYRVQTLMHLGIANFQHPGLPPGRTKELAVAYQTAVPGEVAPGTLGKPVEPVGDLPGRA